MAPHGAICTSSRRNQNRVLTGVYKRIYTVANSRSGVLTRRQRRALPAGYDQDFLNFRARRVTLLE